MANEQRAPRADEHPLIARLRREGARQPLTPGAPDRTVIGKGAALHRPGEPGYLSIRDADRSGHVGCFGTTRVGKALPLQALVHTPKGFRRMGEIVPGDFVSTPDGTSARVLGVFPQGVLPMYRLTFEDGRSVLASGDHLWEIYRAGDTKPELMTTVVLRVRLQQRASLYAIRLTKPVEQPKHNLPVPPYVLGCLLGGDCQDSGDRLLVRCTDPDLAARLRTALHPDMTLERTGPRTAGYAIRSCHPADHRLHALRSTLQELGVLGADSRRPAIPHDYLAGAVEDRLELMRGLLDAKGTILTGGVVQIKIASRQLAKDVQELVWSLGGIARISSARAVSKSGGARYQLTILHPVPESLVTVKRKKTRIADRPPSWPDGLTLRVISIEPAGEAEAACLLVDHPEGLFLTDHYIVTHNTRLLENLIEQDIAKGYSVIVFDPKGDAELFSRMVQVAAQTGRLDELLMLTPIFPDYSARLNPLADYYMQEELVNHVISGIKAKEDYFIAVAMEVSQVVVAGLMKLAEYRGERPQLTFDAIRQRIGFKDLQQLREALATVPGDDAAAICDSIDKIIMAPSLADFFSKVSSSLRTTLSALTFGATGRIIGSASANRITERLESGRSVIVFVNTGSMLTRRTAHIIGKVLLSMIQSLIGRIFASGRKLNPPLCLHLDEGHNLLYPDIQELFSKGGGANCWVHFYSQSMAQISEAVGEAGAQALMDNINTWIYMLINHPDTAKLIERSAPVATRRDGVVALGGGVTSRTAEVPQVTAAQVLQLPKRGFYLRSYGQWFRGTTLDTHPLWLRVEFPTVTAQHAMGGDLGDAGADSELPGGASAIAGA